MDRTEEVHATLRDENEGETIHFLTSLKPVEERHAHLGTGPLLRYNGTQGVHSNSSSVSFHSQPFLNKHTAPVHAIYRTRIIADTF